MCRSQIPRWRRRRAEQVLPDRNGIALSARVSSAGAGRLPVGRSYRRRVRKWRLRAFNIGVCRIVRDGIRSEILHKGREGKRESRILRGVRRITQIIP